MSIDKGYTDTPITGVSTLKYERGLVNFGADFNVVEDNSQEITLTNITSPLDRPEKFRMGYTLIRDIYTNTDVSVNVQAPSKRGVSVLVQLTNTYSDVDLEHKNRVDLPVSTHLVLKFPANAAITADVIQEQVGRLLSGLFETGSVSNDRLKSMMRGSLLPKGI